MSCSQSMGVVCNCSCHLVLVGKQWEWKETVCPLGKFLSSLTGTFWGSFTHLATGFWFSQQWILEIAFFFQTSKVSLLFLLAFYLVYKVMHFDIASSCSFNLVKSPISSPHQCLVSSILRIIFPFIFPVPSCYRKRDLN